MRVYKESNTRIIIWYTYIDEVNPKFKIARSVVYDLCDDEQWYLLNPGFNAVDLGWPEILSDGKMTAVCLGLDPRI